MKNLPGWGIIKWKVKKYKRYNFENKIWRNKRVSNIYGYEIVKFGRYFLLLMNIIEYITKFYYKRLILKYIIVLKREGTLI